MQSSFNASSSSTLGGTVPLSEVQATPAPQLTVQERLVLSRLGVYTGLFYALRAKHPPTAAHALRVAIGCSKWATWRELGESEQDLLEVAALLHDVGKIGVPDQVLQKPTRLDGQELLIMEMQRGIGEEMLRGAGASEELVQVIRLARPRDAAERQGAPIAARMLSIVDAFDSMTTEQVFRRAMSRDRAIDELFKNSGVQFENELVADFAEMISKPRPELEASLAGRWLHSLAPNLTPGFCEAERPVSSGAIQNMVDTLFHHRLLDTLSDAAIYLDADGQILSWNRAAEQLTGRQSQSLINRRWTKELMGLMDADGKPMPPGECPVAKVFETHTQIKQRLSIEHVDGRCFTVHFRALPVISGEQTLSGLIISAHDASAEASLEQKVQSLHEKASRDPLTKVANRAELDRQLPQFVKCHLDSEQRGSVIMCDIDYFKRINDHHGHQAGDEALVTFAGLLKEAARDEDFVARYGGEEFVILCQSCDNPVATDRAEEMRRAIERTPVPALGGQSMTCSFGITEIQPGDDAETLLARADRALMTAKESGRNRVVQIGAGQDLPQRVAQKEDKRFERKKGWLGWFRSAGEALMSGEYLASVPKEVAEQKISGFINDHKAELSVNGDQIVIRVDGNKSATVRRKGERPSVMLLEVNLMDVEVCANGARKTYQKRTKINVSVRPVRARDRRSESLQGQAARLLQSFQAYLVATEIDDELRKVIIEPR